MLPQLLRRGPLAVHRDLERVPIIHSLLYLGAHHREARGGVGRDELLEGVFDDLLAALHHVLVLLLLLVEVVRETLEEAVHQGVAEDAFNQLQVFLVPERLIQLRLLPLLLGRVIARAQAGDLLALLDHVGEAALLDNEIEETLPLPLLGVFGLYLLRLVGYVHLSKISLPLVILKTGVEIHVEDLILAELRAHHVQVVVLRATADLQESRDLQVLGGYGHRRFRLGRLHLSPEQGGGHMGVMRLLARFGHAESYPLPMRARVVPVWLLRGFVHFILFKCFPS